MSFAQGFQIPFGMRLPEVKIELLVASSYFLIHRHGPWAISSRESAQDFGASLIDEMTRRQC